MSKENLFEGDWIVDTEDYGEPSEGHYGWIEVHCPVCGTDFSLEVGQYGWGYGDPFPFLWCPMCGDDKREYNKRMKRNQEAYFKDLNDMADEMGRAMNCECEIQSLEQQGGELLL